jgi:enterochelin esterase-like enzyme
MRFLTATLLLLLTFQVSSAQSPGEERSARQLMDRIAGSSPMQLAVFWDSLLADGQVPYTTRDSVVFLWRGDVMSVAWAGDFSGWQPVPGVRIGGTDVWMLPLGLPPDARIDYKVVIDGAYTLDPVNPRLQVSGFGPNSYVAMPGYRRDSLTVPRGDVGAGRMEGPFRIASASLNEAVAYTVYLPPGYTPGNGPYPVLFVTDGHEYAEPDMGGLPTTLANMIVDGLINPTIAVFVDPRDPDDLAENRRASQFLMNPAYLAFFVDELIPSIEGAYAVTRDGARRGVVGTSFGGVCATYFALSRPDVFGFAGINSPAYWAGLTLIDEATVADRLPERVFLSTGTISDGEGLSRRMRDILTARHQVTLVYREVNEGHSWGNWRNLMPDLLTAFDNRP